MILNILQTVLQDIHDYTIEENRCTRLISPKDSCDKCIQACPLSCISINKKFSINEHCISCGICNRVCPTQAIKMKLQTQDYIIHEADAKGHFVLGCKKYSKPNPTYFNTFCLGSLSDEVLLYLLVKRPTALNNFNDSKCKQCELSSSYEDFLKRKDAIQMHLAEIDFHYDFAKSEEISPSEEYDNDKRAFLMSFLNIRKTLDQTEDEAGNSHANYYHVYHELLKKYPELYGTLDLKFPQKSGKCSYCEACVRLCPSKALTRKGSVVSLVPARCSGCGLCTEVCYDKALSLNTLTLDEFQSASLNIFL